MRGNVSKFNSGIVIMMQIEKNTRKKMVNGNIIIIDVVGLSHYIDNARITMMRCLSISSKICELFICVIWRISGVKCLVFKFINYNFVLSFNSPLLRSAYDSWEPVRIFINSFMCVMMRYNSIAVSKRWKYNFNYFITHSIEMKIRFASLS